MTAHALAPSPKLVVLGLFALVLLAAIVPWLFGGFSIGPEEPRPVTGPVAPAAREPERDRVIEEPPAKPPAPTSADRPAPPPAPAAPNVTPRLPEPAGDDGPWIDRLSSSLVSFASDTPDIDAVLGALADLVSERPPANSGEAGMPNKVQVTLADRNRRANVYVLATGDGTLETYDVTIDLQRGPLPEELRDRYDKLLNCRFFIEVRGEGLPIDVRGAVRFQPVAEESRIGAPFVCGYSIGTFAEGQRLVPFVTEIVRETDDTIGHRTKTDETMSRTAPFADATRLVEAVRPAYGK